jgi:hypothetical protein
MSMAMKGRSSPGYLATSTTRTSTIDPVTTDASVASSELT